MKSYPMLRLVLLILLLLNLIVWSWINNWLAPIGLPISAQSQPEYAAHQLHPEAIGIKALPPDTHIIQTVPKQSNVAPGRPSSEVGQATAERHAASRH